MVSCHRPEINIGNSIWFEDSSNWVYFTADALRLEFALSCNQVEWHDIVTSAFRHKEEFLDGALQSRI
jgi:hypothetical protein